jgi:hypothetical protein
MDEDEMRPSSNAAHNGKCKVDAVAAAVAADSAVAVAGWKAA